MFRLLLRNRSGVSIRIRGGMTLPLENHTLEKATARQQQGSSPRGRGTLLQVAHDLAVQRFIPAWAGNTNPYSITAKSITAHPRVGGEHISRDAAVRHCTGSSPRGRGTRPSRPSRPTVHPHVGGEHNKRVSTLGKIHGSSPRGRGTRPDRSLPATRLRFIPAWAGNTESSSTASRSVSVHPRVGGEHAYCSPGTA